MRPIIVALLLSLLAAMTPLPARAQAAMDLGSLIHRLQIGDFGSISEPLYNANTVYVIRVTQLAGIRIQGDRLSRVLEIRQRYLRSLRQAVRNSREAMRALERHHEELQSVIFATSTNDGTATLYVDNR